MTSYIFHPLTDETPSATGENRVESITAQGTFGLYGEAGFSPHYVPTRFRVGKERNLDRSESFCGGEDVEDLGSKNRELHISGWLRESEISAFDDLLDSDATHDIVTPGGGWDGEVRVLDGEYEGPRSFDPFSRELLFKYSMNVLSTGRDESSSGGYGNGIVQEGTDEDDPYGVERLGF
jgi:hypothetical protein